MPLAQNSVVTFATKVFIFLCRFPVAILIARWLGPDGKGVLYLIFTSVTMSVALGSLGLGPAAIYTIGQDRRHLSAILGQLFAAAGIVGLIISVAGWCFLQFGRPDLYAQLPSWIWITMAWLVPLQLLRSWLMQVLSSVLRIKEINLVDVAAVVTHLLLLVLFVVVLDKGIGGAFLAQALADVLAATGFFLMIVRHCGWPSMPDWALFRTSLRYGVKSYLANLMRRLNLRLDAFLVTTLAANGVYATGVYSVATNLAELILFVPVSVRLSLFPIVASHEPAEADRLTSMSCRHTLLLTLAGAGGLIAFGPYLIHQLYGDRFGQAVLPLLILLPGVVMLSQTYIFYSYLNGRGKPGMTAISGVLSLIVTVCLDVVLIPRYGILGAAIASTCAYAAQFLTTGYFFMHLSGMRWRDVLIIQRSDLHYYMRVLTQARGVMTSRR